MPHRATYRPSIEGTLHGSSRAVSRTSRGSVTTARRGRGAAPEDLDGLLILFAIDERGFVKERMPGSLPRPKTPPRTVAEGWSKKQMAWSERDADAFIVMGGC